MKIPAALFLAFCLLASVSCAKEEEPSYVGTWWYEKSEPDLGPGYRDSRVSIKANGEYEFFDGGTGRSFSGDAGDFMHDGMTITLSAHNDTEQRTYVAVVRRLKGGVMVVETDSVNGILTLITFLKR